MFDFHDNAATVNAEEVPVWTAENLDGKEFVLGCLMNVQAKNTKDRNLVFAKRAILTNEVHPNYATSRLKAAVIDTMYEDGEYYVYDSGAVLWKFEAVPNETNNKYYMTTQVGETIKYLTINGSSNADSSKSVGLNDTPSIITVFQRDSDGAFHFENDNGVAVNLYNENVTGGFGAWKGDDYNSFFSLYEKVDMPEIMRNLDGKSFSLLNTKTVEAERSQIGGNNRVALTDNLQANNLALKAWPVEIAERNDIYYTDNDGKNVFWNFENANVGENKYYLSSGTGADRKYLKIPRNANGTFELSAAKTEDHIITVTMLKNCKKFLFTTESETAIILYGAQDGRIGTGFRSDNDSKKFSDRGLFYLCEKSDTYSEFSFNSQPLNGSSFALAHCYQNGSATDIALTADVHQRWDSRLAATNSTEVFKIGNNYYIHNKVTRFNPLYQYSSANSIVTWSLCSRSDCTKSFHSFSK